MNSERLLKLASELERCSRGNVLTIPGDGKADFDLAVVAIGTIRGDKPYQEYRCGSACCAMGFAGVHPWFQKRGLRWSPVPKNGSNTPFTINGCVAGGFANAGAKFFGIDFEDAANLFTVGDNSETPKQYARRIRKFVADHTA